MESILIDAGPLIALFNRDDAYHMQIRKYLQANCVKLLSTWPVLTEVSYMLGFNVNAQIDFMKWVYSGGLNLVSIDQNDMYRIIEMTDKYSDVPMDLADASLMLIAESSGIRKILTIDSDFQIFKTRYRERLDSVPLLPGTHK